MKFQPKTDEEIKLAMCAQPGVYDFEVIGAEDKLSKKGNPMTVVALRYWVGGGERTMNDYLMEKMAFKLKHFAQAIGMLEAYENGDLEPATLPGRTGKVIIGVEEQEGYGPRNYVEDYVVPGKEPVVKSKPLAVKAAGGGTSAPLDEPPFAALNEFGI